MFSSNNRNSNSSSLPFFGKNNSSNNGGTGSGLRGWWNSEGTSAVTIITSAVLLIVLVIVIIYAVYRYNQSNLEEVVLVESPIKLYGLSEAKKFSSKDLTTASVGQSFTYSLWLYIVDYDDASNDHRLVFMRNDSEDDLNGANPIVFMDGRTNRMYISARTNTSREVSDLADLVPQRPSGKNANNFLTATIEYVPLQRWVNVVVVFQDNLMTVFLDGDMYAVRNVHDLWSRDTQQNRPILSGSQGDLWVGPTTQNSDTIRGFLSGVKYFNYALMPDAVQALYMHGPDYRSMLKAVGLEWTRKYGLQSPIYKLDKDKDKDGDGDGDDKEDSSSD